MRKYIFYTFEGHTQSPNGDEVENCQMLGESIGENENDALEKLMANNPWIKDLGYNPINIVVRELVQ